MTGPGSSRSRVVLHVGVPKSGTTFLQKALWLNREPLREAGFRLPGASQREMFLAAIEVRGTHRNWGMPADAVQGTWRRLSEEATDFAGTTIMSHELLAAATPEQIGPALAQLGDAEVHLVLTGRDLARQAISEWQERIKNGNTATFGKFQATLTKGIDARNFGGLFWRYHHIPDILDRWGADIPASNVHLVTSPVSSADPAALWRRFGEAAGFDADPLDPTVPDGTANQSLGVAQIAILRQVNEALDGRIVQPAYARVVKRHVGQDLLTRHTSPRPSCPPELVAPLRELSEEWLREIERRGYTVHGDLADLLPAEPRTEAPQPDAVDLDEQAAISATVIADLLVEVAELRGRVRRLSARTPGSRLRGGERARRALRSLLRR
ncbi:MAG: hypothetical protein ACRDOM_04065 [Nocardioides sp.]